MGNSDNEISNAYLKTLLSYYEEEISGEAYLYALAEHFDEKDKMNLLARIERRAAESIQPLLEKYGLEPRDESVLNREGRGYLESHESYSWPEFMEYIVKRYPGYLDDFHALEQMAPDADLPALNILTDHEVAVIDFAKKEIAGDPSSTTALLQYLA
jgi:dimethylamine/trimethylamine dehydrogenase